MPYQTLTPVAAQERIQTIDIIRGIALYGALISTFTIDNGSNGPWQWPGFGDQFIYWTFRFFIDDKFINIYCFLFGLGFAIQMLRAENRNASFFFVYLRRLIALYLIGLACYILIAAYNIIFMLYAISGILLLLFRRLSLNLILILTFLLFIAPWVRQGIGVQKYHSALSQPAISPDSNIFKKYEGVYGTTPAFRIIITIENAELKFQDHSGNWSLTALSDEKFISKRNKSFFTFLGKAADSIERLTIDDIYWFKEKYKKVDMSIEEAKKELQEWKTPIENNKNYGQFVANNFIRYRNELKGLSWRIFFWHHFAGVVPFFFLIGLYAGRRKLFYNVSANQVLFRRLRFWGLLTGSVFITISLGREALKFIAGSNWKPLSEPIHFLIQFSWSLGCILMAIGIIALITLACEKEIWRKGMSLFIPVGRLTLSNYILGGILGFLLFTDWGLNMKGKVGGFYGLLIIIPICIAIYFFSRWWLNHFKYGPFEWLWRSLTYLKFQPMRLNKNDMGQT